MQAILQSQRNFIAANEPTYAAAANDPMMMDKTASRLQVFLQKIKEIGAAVKIASGQLTGSRDASGQMLPFAERGDFTSGLLGGLGLEGLQKLYVDRQTMAEQASSGGEESALERSEKEKQVIENSSDSTRYLMELNDSAKTYYPFIEATSKDIKELKEFMMANWSSLGGGGGLGLPLPGGGGGRAGGAKPKPGGAKVPGGKAPSKIPGALGGAAKVLGRLAAPLAIVGGGLEIYQNEKAVESGDLTREQATKGNVEAVAGTATGMAGAAAGAKMGLIAGAMTGPAAPIAVPVLSILGGIAGFFAGDKLGRVVADAAMSNTNVNTEDMGDPEANLVAPPVLNSIPEVTQDVNNARQQLDTTMRAIQANPIDQKVTNNVQQNTTIINPRNNVAPSNPDATFRGFTGESAFPIAP